MTEMKITPKIVKELTHEEVLFAVAGMCDIYTIEQNNLKNHIKLLLEENQRLRTALEFYAYKHGYQPYYDSVHGDEGEIARAALKEQPL